jgi:hypothetical protein
MASANVPQPHTAGAFLPSASTNRSAAFTAGLSSQWFDMPSTHRRQVPHAGVTDARTRSPGRTRRTSGPTSSTTPQPSWPSAIGSGSADSPLRTLRSVWQIPLAVTRTRTSRAPTAGTGRSSTTAGRPAS